MGISRFWWNLPGYNGEFSIAMLVFPDGTCFFQQKKPSLPHHWTTGPWSRRHPRPPTKSPQRKIWRDRRWCSLSTTESQKLLKKKGWIKPLKKPYKNSWIFMMNIHEVQKHNCKRRSNSNRYSNNTDPNNINKQTCVMSLANNKSTSLNWRSLGIPTLGKRTSSWSKSCENLESYALALGACRNVNFSRLWTAGPHQTGNKAIPWNSWKLWGKWNVRMCCDLRINPINRYTSNIIQQRWTQNVGFILFGVVHFHAQDFKHCGHSVHGRHAGLQQVGVSSCIRPMKGI